MHPLQLFFISAFPMKRPLKTLARLKCTEGSITARQTLGGNRSRNFRSFIEALACTTGRLNRKSGALSAASAQCRVPIEPLPLV